MLLAKENTEMPRVETALLEHPASPKVRNMVYYFLWVIGSPQSIYIFFEPNKRKACWIPSGSNLNILGVTPFPSAAAWGSIQMALRRVSVKYMKSTFVGKRGAISDSNPKWTSIWMRFNNTKTLLWATYGKMLTFCLFWITWWIPNCSGQLADLLSTFETTS